jgi:hypothetical protein
VSDFQQSTHIVTRGLVQNTVNLYVPNAMLRETSADALLDLMRTVAALPHVLACRASADPDIRSFIDLHKLPFLPSFNFILGWAHLVAPRAIAPYYLPEDLLRAPAYRVQRLDNGLIELLVYARPLDYRLPKSRERILELTCYFAATRRQ